MTTTVPNRTLITPAPVAARDEVQLARRIVVGLGLAVVAAIHVLDLPGKFEETPYLAVAYIGLIVVAAVIAERLFQRASRLDFAAAAALSGMAFLAFVVNRTVGMPGAMDDIGNWLEPLGLLSLVVEAFVVWQAIAALATLPRRSATAR